jgi:hypothetical protein
LCGLLIYLFQSQGDHFSLNFNTPHGFKFLSPSRGPDALHRFIGELADCQTIKTDDQIHTLKQIQSEVSRPAHIWVITDFDHEPEPLLKKLKELKQMGHDVTVLHVFHPSERELLWKGLIQFEDLEGRVAKQELTPEIIAQDYQLAYDQHIDSIIKNCQINEINLNFIDVTQSPESWVTSLFSSSD